MKNTPQQLEQIAAQLNLLAKEGHGGSEARLVRILAYNSRKLQAIAKEKRKQASKQNVSRFPTFTVLIMLKFLYDLLSSLAS